jgi:hypothetical protein
MKSLSLRRILALVLLLGLLVLGAGVWLIGSEYGRRRVEQWVRTKLTEHSELVLAPFRVELNPWRDFPHLTASLHHLSLSDTTAQQSLTVLHVGRADLRLELLALLRGQVRVSRLHLDEVDFRERTDSLGRRWGLRGSRPRGTGKVPDLSLGLDSLLITNFRMSTRNEYSRSSFGASVRQARLSGQLRRGVLQVSGNLSGQLDYLRNRGGTLFEAEPVRARVTYRYDFARHQGSFQHTRATLNGDTIQVSGTHTAAVDQPAGTRFKLKFEGQQPLMDVLHQALPPTLEHFLTGAHSTSKAHISYSIEGLSGPKVSPRNVLTFALNGAHLQWPDSARRINRWDLRGTFDNGPAHRSESTVLTLQRCRIYSSAGQLDVALTLRDFAHPLVQGWLRGRTELPELAAVLTPGVWRARHGIADLDVHLRGRLPGAGEGGAGALLRKQMSVRGSVTLRNASFVLLDRGADISGLNVRVGLRDSLWQLTNASGVLDQMRFRASATTTYLLDYLTDQHETTSISGNFEVDELRVGRMRELLRPRPRLKPRSEAAQRRQQVRATRGQLATRLGSSLFPPGLHLNIGLRCQRLVLAADTLTNLAVTVRHDGQQVQLLDLAGRVWDGEVSGQLGWPTDANNQVATIHYQLTGRFDTINYRQLIARLSQPPRRPGRAKAKRAGTRAASPALRELLLAANGELNWEIKAVQLPDGQRLSNLRLRVDKQGSLLNMPSLRFGLPGGGTGQVSGSARVANMHLEMADASVNLYYPTLDVQHLLILIASLTMPPDSVPVARQTTARCWPTAPSPLCCGCKPTRFATAPSAGAGSGWCRTCAMAKPASTTAPCRPCRDASPCAAACSPMPGATTTPCTPRPCWRAFSCPIYLPRPRPWASTC